MPPTPYTRAVASAGISIKVAAKTRVMTAIRTPRSRTTPALSANCSSSSARRPKSFSSIAPPTLNRSVIELPRSALPFIWSRVIPTSRLPTQRDEMNKMGNVARHSSVTCQLSANITTPTKTTLITLETVDDNVEVNARCAPITSLLSRDTRAPVWVRVKNANDMRCTWANTLVRRSKMRPSPMREESQPMPTASAASRTATPAAASARPTTSAASSLRMPSSTMCLTSSGVTTTSAASTTVRARKNAIVRRCGLANPTTRRTVLRASFWPVMLRSVRM